MIYYLTNYKYLLHNYCRNAFVICSIIDWSCTCFLATCKIFITTDWRWSGVFPYKNALTMCLAISKFKDAAIKTDAANGSFSIFVINESISSIGNWTP